MSANDTQVDGEHYKNVAIEIWDFIVANEIPYLEGNAVKYIVRWRKKGGIKDLEKAQHYIAKLIEVAHIEEEEAEAAAAALAAANPRRRRNA